MISPIININGGSADDLIKPRLMAMDLINDVIEELKRVTPNGRDYPGAYERYHEDRAEHYERLQRLRLIHEEIFAEALAIKEQRS